MAYVSSVRKQAGGGGTGRVREGWGAWLGLRAGCFFYRPPRTPPSLPCPPALSLSLKLSIERVDVDEGPGMVIN